SFARRLGDRLPALFRTGAPARLWHGRLCLGDGAAARDVRVERAGAQELGSDRIPSRRSGACRTSPVAARETRLAPGSDALQLSDHIGGLVVGVLVDLDRRDFAPLR